MGKTAFRLLVVAVVLGGPLTAAADEALDGHALHQAQCDGCHAARYDGDGSGLYTRDNRRVTSLHKLRHQVAFCNQQVGAGWFEEEEAAVVDYLNRAYYHFSQ